MTNQYAIILNMSNINELISKNNMSIENFRINFISKLENSYLKNAFINNNFIPISCVKEFVEKTELKIDNGNFISNYILNLCLENNLIYIDKTILSVLEISMYDLINDLINNCILNLDFNLYNIKDYKIFFKNHIRNTNLELYFPHYKIKNSNNYIHVIITGDCLLKLMNKNKFKYNDKYKKITDLSSLYSDYKILFMIYNYICKNLEI